jgi:hypothetical protein
MLGITCSSLCKLEITVVKTISRIGDKGVARPAICEQVLDGVQLHLWVKSQQQCGAESPSFLDKVSRQCTEYCHAKCEVF